MAQTVMAYFHQTEMDSDSDSDSDSFPDGYIVLCRTFSTGLDSDLDPVRRVSHMVTVPTLETNLPPRDISPSLFHTFESGDQSPNLNQWKNLHSTRIRVGI